ncbi:hypothetical protein LguiA_029950 [Lonicera macranthoides]
MAASVGISSDFPYVKIILTKSMIGLSESSKCAQIVKVFEATGVCCDWTSIFKCNFSNVVGPPQTAASKGENYNAGWDYK